VRRGKAARVLGAVGATLAVVGIAGIILQEYMRIRHGDVVTAAPTVAKFGIIASILALAGWQSWRRSRLKRNS
jgi:hypothetical protein